MSNSALMTASDPASKGLIQVWNSYEKRNVHSSTHSLFTHPKTVFVSLSQFFQSFENICFDTIYHSILIFKAKKEWILNDNQRTEANECRKESLTAKFEEISKRYRFAETNKCESQKMCEFLIAHSSRSQLAAFRTLLRLKESQNMILWLDPSNESIGGTDETHSKWQRISRFVSSIFDPISQTNFNPIITDLNWWQTKYIAAVEFQLKKCNSAEKKALHCYTQFEHCSLAEMIADELISGAFEFKAAMEILQQSNPTLIAMAAYDEKRLNIKRNSIVELGRYFSQMSSDESNIGRDSSKALDIGFDIRGLRQLRVLFSIKDSDGFVYIV